jgi:transcription elongation factor GreA
VTKRHGIRPDGEIMSDPTTTWMTQEQYDRLQSEFQYLTGQGRMDIAKKIEEARLEGDLKENGGYHAAKEEQGKMDGRARQLRQLLENAQVGAPPRAADGSITQGLVVTVRLAGQELTFLLGSRDGADLGELDVYSEKSPLGGAVLGHKIGETTSYTAPNGKKVSVEILGCRPLNG